ncbi:amino acid adenylation domain-containing protein, partial [Streptomyces umbrinus]|uniref:amino acid adenylation domain-containing protein n=1 Tax=Streptomyces umbrinus TaxID=67370 RepID=UPI003C2ADC1C
MTGVDATAVREVAEQLSGRGVAATVDAGVAAAQTVILLAGPAEHGTVDEFERTQRGWVTAFREALALFDRTGARRLLVVTEDVHVTGHGSERPDPAQAVLGALALAVPEEFPGAVANWVDLASLDDAGQRLRAVLAEAAAPQAAGVVAWRDGRRLVRTVVPQPAEAPHGGERLPADGTFLITGGCGGIGSALARDLAGRGRPVVILTGRSPQPPEGLVKELAALGADARYHPADLADRDDVEKLVAELPPLDGVFHAAGVVRPGSLRSTDVQEAVDALQAKTLGTRLLAEALQRHGRRPGACVAFSSVSSVLPGLAGALGVYAAANAFLDSFAAAERQAGRPWLSVNLGPFAETGLASSLASSLGVGSVARAGSRPLATAPALAALRSACDTDEAQLVLADLTSVRGPVLADSPQLKRSAAIPPQQATSAPGARQPSVADGPASVSVPVSGAAAVLRELLAQSLGVPASAVDDDAPFLSLGLDSLGAVDLVKRLERRTGRPWPTTLFFEYRTVRELAAHLDTQTSAGAEAGADAAESGRDTHRAPLSPAADDGTPFALTPVQLALYTSSRLHPDVPARGHLRLTIRGPLDTHVLGRALTALAERHGMLRLRIDGAGAMPMQRLAPTMPLRTWYEVCEGSAQSVADVESALSNRPFDLTVEPPVRAVVLRQEPSLSHLLLVVHHAAADGYSLNVLAEDLWALYTSLWRGEHPQLTPRSLDFATYVAARVHSPGSNSSEGTRNYWAERLAGRGEPLRLPYDGDPDAPPSGPLVQHHGELDATLTTGLEQLAAAHDVSLFHLLLAAYVRCLVRWTGRRDIAVNVARARREDRFDGVDRLVGPLADTLPLLCEADPEEPLVTLAARLRETWLESERHADLSSLDLAALLSGADGGPRTASPAGFSFARFPARLAADCPVDVRATAAGTGSAATRLSLLCWADGPVLRMSWNFPLPLFERETVARLDQEYREELAALCAVPVPPAPVTDLSPASLVASVPLTGSDGGPSLVARLLERFRATPTATAVDDGTTTLTYADLDRASALLAARLRALGVRPGDLVGLLTEPGPETVIGVVGILRAGAGWVPLDAGHPTARLADQLARTGATVVVCHASTSSTASTLRGVRALAVDDLPNSLASIGEDSAAEAEAIAYVIFTSGSTGRPKAVPITHRAMENYLDWAVATFGYGPQDRLAQTASPCFDASVRQLLAPLMVGATVVTVPRDLRRDPELLPAYVEQARITVWSSVPTLWEQLLSAAEEQVRRGAARPDLSALRWVHVGGEALPAPHVRRWFDLFGTGTRIANLYGPTEATINATCHVIDVRPDDDVQLLPIGRPVAGTELEVVGPDGTPCGPGGFGELLIAGVGLTPGYLGEPDLTARAFAVRDGRRWYRSGDRVRRGEGGTLEFLGRVDDQVKIRGNRVEPGEVEAALQTHPGIARAAVTACEGRLLAFVTVRPGSGRPDTRDVRGHLSDIVPPYMIPARITVVDALPLTGTGKVDRRALPDRATASVDRAGKASTALPLTAGRGTSPATPTEQRLAAIWSELLEADPVCREDDFFDLGGDSMLVLQVFARLGEQEGPLPRPTAIYRHRTLAALAAAVDAAIDTPAGQPCGTRTPTGTETVTAAGSRPAGEDHTSPFPLTPGQRGFLLAEELSPGGGSWLARLRLSGPLDQEVFQAAVDLLVERHAMLRTVFPSGARPPVQQELPRSLRLPVVFETLRDRGDVDKRAAAEAGRRFEPWTWPLLRLRVLTLAPHEHVLLVHAHHLIGDGYSAALLMQELTDAYDLLTADRTAELPTPRATFRDHCLLLAETGVEADAGTEAGAEVACDSAADAAARRARLSAPYQPPVLRAPYDGSGSTTTSDANPAFHSAEFVLDATRTAALRALAAEAGATLYAPLLTAYYQQLAEATGQADLILGLAVSGRDRPLPDVHRIFGPFAAAVPVRPGATAGQESAEGHFGDALRRIVAEAEEARTHDDVLPRHANGLPVTSQFFFTFLDFSALAASNGGTLTVSWEDAD